MNPYDVPETTTPVRKASQRNRSYIDEGDALGRKWFESHSGRSMHHAHSFDHDFEVEKYLSAQKLALLDFEIMVE